MNFNKIKLLWLLCFAVMGSAAFAAEIANYNHLLRDKRTGCGFYLAKLSSEFNGRKITDDLDPARLQNALGDFDPKVERLVAVGAPPDWMSRRKLRQQVAKALDDAGYPHAKFSAIRHIGKYLESKVGVFAFVPGQGMKRLAGLDPKDLAASLNGGQVKALLDAGGSIVVSGAPIIGPSRSKLKASVLATVQDAAAQSGILVDPKFVDMRSKAQVWARAFAEDPKKASLDMWYGVRSFFPYSEDMVTPTEGEKRTMGQKVTMHTLFTLISFAFQGESLQVVIPVTIMNGVNSAFTGTYRSYLGNWLSRGGGSTVLRTIKGMMLSSLFTFDLYLARNAFHGDVLASFAGVSGWSNFFAASWVTVLFQSMWRTPVSTVLHSWERWRSESGGVDSAWARNVGGSAEKFMTYFMTQLYIVSLVIKSSFFKLIWTTGDGVGVLSGYENIDSGLGQTLLMNFNIGHAAMATVGLAAFAMKNHYKLFDKALPLIAWLDNLETKGYQFGVKGIKKTLSFLKPASDSSDPNANP